MSNVQGLSSSLCFDNAIRALFGGTKLSDTPTRTLRFLWARNLSSSPSWSSWFAMKCSCCRIFLSWNRLGPGLDCERRVFTVPINPCALGGGGFSWNLDLWFEPIAGPTGPGFSCGWCCEDEIVCISWEYLQCFPNRHWPFSLNILHIFAFLPVGITTSVIFTCFSRTDCFFISAFSNGFNQTEPTWLLLKLGLGLGSIFLFFFFFPNPGTFSFAIWGLGSFSLAWSSSVSSEEASSSESALSSIRWFFPGSSVTSSCCLKIWYAQLNPLPYNSNKPDRH